MTRRLLPSAVAVAVAGLLALPGGAAAHVSVEPATADAATEITATFRVPNERDGDPTVKVDLQLPEGVTGAAPQPVEGWVSTVEGRTVTWTGGRIEGSDARRFPVRLTLPDDEGAELAFKVLQTYDSGEVVRWIGAAGSENEAAVMKLGAAPAGAAAPEETATPEPTVSPEPAATPTVTPDVATAAEPDESSDDDGAGGLVIGGAIAGLVLVAGLVALLARRRATEGA